MADTAVAGVDGALPAERSPRLAKWLAWAHRGGLSILDQGLFAGANFVLNILLARWLAPEAYGAFTLAYSVFLFIGAFYLALFMEPFLIYAAGERRSQFRRYLGFLLGTHWRGTTVAAGLTAIASLSVLAIGHHGQALAFAGLAAALPFLLQLWLMRTVFYARTQPHCAAAGSAVFFVVQVGGIAALHALGWLGPFSAFLVSGVASCAAGFAMRALVGVGLRRETAPDDDAFRRGVVADHVAYAKWATGVSVIAWLCSNVHYFILTSTGGGLAAVGAMKMLDNLLTPFYQCISALGQLLMPVVASRAGDRRAFVGRTLAVAGCWVGIAIVGLAALQLLGHDLLRLLFGSEHAAALEGPLRAYALVTVPYVLAMALMLGLRAKVRTDLVFIYHLLFAGVLTIAYLIAARHGLWGIVWSNVGTRVLFLPVIVALFLRAAKAPARVGARAQA